MQHRILHQWRPPTEGPSPAPSASCPAFGSSEQSEAPASPGAHQLGGHQTNGQFLGINFKVLRNITCWVFEIDFDELPKMPCAWFVGINLVYPSKCATLNTYTVLKCLLKKKNCRFKRMQPERCKSALFFSFLLPFLKGRLFPTWLSRTTQVTRHRPVPSRDATSGGSAWSLGLWAKRWRSPRKGGSSTCHMALPGSRSKLCSFQKVGIWPFGVGLFQVISL